MRIIVLLIFVFTVVSSHGQIWIEDFDGSNSTAPINTSTQCGGDPGDYHFGVVCENGGGCAIEMNALWTGLYTNVMGSFLGALDTDNANGCGGVGFDDEFAEWTGIDISSCTDPNSLYLCFDIAHFGNDFAPFGGWDPPSNITFDATIDGGTTYTLVAVEDQGPDTNPAFDLDCDGSGDPGEEITPEFTTYCVVMPGLGTTVDIRINIDGLNEDWEDIGIDNVAVYCEADETSLTGTFLSPCGDCSIDVDCDGVVLTEDCDDNDASVAIPLPATFDVIPNQCEGEADPLPSTSLEGFTGTWAPAFDPNNTTTYTFTPDAGQCAADGTASVNIDPEAVSTFDAIPNQCEGEADPLPATSLEGFTGTWTPTFDPDNTTTYTFTPDAGQCATSGTASVNIDSEVTSTFDVIPNQCEGEADPIPATSLEGFTGTWTPVFDPNNTTTYTFTPDAGQCAADGATTVNIDAETLSTFAAIPNQCEGEADPLPATSLEGFTGTWAPVFDPNNTETYTFTPDAGQCAADGTVTVNIDAEIPSTFAPIPNQCEGETDPLPTTSLEGFTGTWTPAFDPNNTTTYTFITDAGQCAANGTVTVNIDAETPSTFAAIPNQCEGQSDPLPTTSLEGFTGTWTPAFDPNNTTTYTFTTDAGQCAANGTTTVTIDPVTTSTFAVIPNQCEGEADPLPTTSLEGFTGTWTPAFDPNNTTTYTFTTDAGQCAADGTTTVTIDAVTTSTFAVIPNQCEGEADPLPTTSLEGFTGTWTPAFDPNNTTTYTFTPNPGQCAADGTATITIDIPIIPDFTAPTPFCELDDQVYTLSGTSGNGVTGTWSPASSYVPSVLSVGTTVFTFTPDPSICAEELLINIDVDASVIPTFVQLGPYCVDDIPDVLNTVSLNGISGSWDGPISTITPGTTTYTFTPDNGLCADETTMNILIEDCGCMNPATLSIDPIVPICEDETLSLNATLGGSASQVTWSTSGDGSFDNINSLSPIYTPGAIDISGGTVTLIATSDDPDASGPCSAVTDQAILTINSLISPLFTQLGPYCQGDIPDVFSTTSLNGVGGTWDGPINTSSPGSTNYTFTPNSNQCANSTTMSIVIEAPIMASFDAIPNQCAGGLDPLPATSLEGFTGNWTPAFDPNNTTTYTFIVDAGQCALDGNLAVTIDPATTPTFTQLGPYCVDDIPDVLPDNSSNGISGSWDGPIITSSPSTIIYTFTPSTFECAVTTTMQIEVEDCDCTDPAQISIEPTLAICENEIITLMAIVGGSATMVNWSTNGDGTFDNPTSTTPVYTPGANDIIAGSVNVTATTNDPDGTGPCSEASANEILSIDSQIAPLFTQLGPYCVDATPDVLPLISLNGIEGIWDGPINTLNPGLSSYTFIPNSGECAISAMMNIEVNDCGCSDPTQITIDAISPICENETINLTANLGGSASTVIWSTDGDGFFDNLTSTTPMYTPGINDIASGSAALTATTDDPDGMGPCTETSASVLLTINSQAVPEFMQLGPYCIDDTPDVLPLTAMNGITGIWDGPILTSNSGSSIYTFTPNTTECATSTSMEIIINDCGCPDPAEISLDNISPICENETINLTANLGGSASTVTWSTDGDGSFDNMTSITPIYTPGANDIATGSVSLIATTDDPDGIGPCSESSASIPLIINAQSLPQFMQLGPYCIDATPDILPMVSMNGIEGTWDGPILTSDSGSSIYTFTPNTGECATSTSMEIIINDCGCPDPAEISIDDISPICENETINLTANLGGSASTVTWSSDGDGSFDNMTSLTPIYTPGANDIATGSVSLTATTDDPDGIGPCTESSTNVIITINPQTFPQFMQLGPYCIDDTPDVLPLTSLNGITGTWDGPIITSNLGSIVYTFIPDSDQCAATFTTTIEVESCDCNDQITITQPCDDDDDCTINDEETIIESNGEVCIPCAGELVDCSTGEIEFSPCDDDNPCTTNDVIGLQSCTGEICIPCTGIIASSSQINYPNIFSPNADGSNDNFTLYTSADNAIITSLDIYDRLGNKIFSKENFIPNSVDLGWDGTMNNQNVNPGVYVFVAVVVFENCNSFTVFDDITVIR